ncbi:hypothetical protein [Flavobacterium sp.]|jgi:hypothetical protein|uniref:hypothetical protein n=1 Tax=Flavobacterium sp. TaxID=239 RepID=UPI0037BE48A6
MTYTLEQLQKMRKSSVDFALAKLVLKRPIERGGHPSYCVFAGDTMPLAFQHKICLINSESGWIAFLFDTTNGDIEFEDKNPLRAIACCLILVLQEQK